MGRSRPGPLGGCGEGTGWESCSLLLAHCTAANYKRLFVTGRSSNNCNHRWNRYLKRRVESIDAAAPKTLQQALNHACGISNDQPQLTTSYSNKSSNLRPWIQVSFFFFVWCSSVNLTVQRTVNLYGVWYWCRCHRERNGSTAHYFICWRNHKHNAYIIT